MPPQPQLDSDGLFPWRYLLRALAAVFQLRVLLPAATAVVLAAAGDGILSHLLSVDARVDHGAIIPASAQELALSALQGSLRYWQSMVAPFWSAPSSPPHFLIGLWRLVVWLLAGGAIARAVAQSLTHRDASGVRELAKHSASVMPGRMAVLGCLLLLVGGLLIPLVLHAWMLRSPWLELFSAALLPIPLLLALAAAVLGVCGALGWPLLVVAGSVELPDPFDAASRALAYVTQRPAHLTAYGLVALMVGAPVGALAQVIAAVGWEMSGAALETALATSGVSAGRLSAFWVVGLFTALPRVYYAAYFWSAVTALYLLLRRDIDDVQVDEMAEASEASRG